jgi:hypothetical protein
LLHHIDESWFEFETAISNVRLRSSSDIATGRSRKVINELPATICVGYCGGGDPKNLSTISRTWDPEDPVEENLDRGFLIKDSGSEW